MNHDASPAEDTPRTVVITGAAGNLGQAVARAFGASGDRLVLVDLHRDRLESAFGADDDHHVLAPADLLLQPQVDAAMRLAVDHFGRIDVLCNLAGGFRMGDPVHETGDDDWNFLFDVNARCLLNVARAAVPRLIAGGGGAIVNVGAAAALQGRPGMGAYCAAKGVVVRLTESMAAELREQQINVNCVLPTIIDTPENRRAMPEADPARWVAPDDLAAVVLFLASRAARAIHGAALPVTGLS